MRRIAAHWLFDGENILPYPLVDLDDTGRITGLHSSKQMHKEAAGTEFYSGMLCPGFINVHTHTELAGLQSRSDITTLSGFLSYVVEARPTLTPSKIQAKQKNLIAYYSDLGISAYADILNIANLNETDSSVPARRAFYEFIPVSEKRVSEQMQLYARLKKSGPIHGIALHSPYTVSKEGWKALWQFIEADTHIFSMHFRENFEEIDMLDKRSGALYDKIIRAVPEFTPLGNALGSLQLILEKLHACKRFLFVHNVVIRREDLVLIDDRLDDRAYYVVCPSSNLKLSGDLAPNFLFDNKPDYICMGTDSTASSENQSVFGELKIIERYRSISLVSLLKFATINGAKALNIDSEYGSIRLGKRPGINLITDIDVTRGILGQKAKFSKLV